MDLRLLEATQAAAQAVQRQVHTIAQPLHQVPIIALPRVLMEVPLPVAPVLIAVHQLAAAVLIVVHRAAAQVHTAAHLLAAAVLTAAHQVAAQTLMEALHQAALVHIPVLQAAVHLVLIAVPLLPTISLFTIHKGFNISREALIFRTFRIMFYRHKLGNTKF